MEDLSATAHLMSSGGETRKWNVVNVKEFMDEYYYEKSRPIPPPPYWTRDSHIATLSHYLKEVDEALKQPDALEKVKAIMLDFNTPKAVA